MKSKIAILSLLLTGAAVSASAQTKEHYYSEKAVSYTHLTLPTTPYV